jgi:hypothetical protein
LKRRQGNVTGVVLAVVFGDAADAILAVTSREGSGLGRCVPVGEFWSCSLQNTPLDFRPRAVPTAALRFSGSGGRCFLGACSPATIHSDIRTFSFPLKARTEGEIVGIGLM